MGVLDRPYIFITFSKTPSLAWRHICPLPNRNITIKIIQEREKFKNLFRYDIFLWKLQDIFQIMSLTSEKSEKWHKIRNYTTKVKLDDPALFHASFTVWTFLKCSYNFNLIFELSRFSINLIQLVANNIYILYR